MSKFLLIEKVERTVTISQSDTWSYNIQVVESVEFEKCELYDVHATIEKYKVHYPMSAQEMVEQFIRDSEFNVRFQDRNVGNSRVFITVQVMQL